MAYSGLEEGLTMRAGRLYKKEALVAVLAICAVTLMAASYAGLNSSLYVGTTVDMMEIPVNTPVAVPLVTGSMLAQIPMSSESTGFQQLAEEKELVGNKLAKDMRKMWAAKSRSAKQVDMQKVEALRSQFESLLDTIDSAPILKPYRGPNGEMRAMNPQDGRVYEIYPYQGRNEYASQASPMLYDDQPYNINPVFIDDSYIPRFTNPPEQRNPIYQGVYPEYFVAADGTGQLRLIPKAAAPALFARSAEGAETDGATANTEQPDPAQQEWAAHSGELMRRMRAQLSEARRARLSSSALVQNSVDGGADEEPASAEEEPASAAETADATEPAEAATSMPQSDASEDSTAPAGSAVAAVSRRSALRHSMDSIVGQAWRGDEVIAAADAADAKAADAAGTAAPQAALADAAPAAAAAATAPRRHSAPSNPLLRESGRHVYGSVYNPLMDPRVNPALAAGDEFTDLRGPAKGYFDHYQRLSSRVLDVKDPARTGDPGADWWTGPAKRDKWWQHDHEGRGY